MGRRNNQPNDGVGSGMGIGEAMKMGGTRGGRLLLIALGGKWSDEKNKNRAGWEYTTTNQKAAVTLQYNMERRRGGQRR